MAQGYKIDLSLAVDSLEAMRCLRDTLEASSPIHWTPSSPVWNILLLNSRNQKFCAALCLIQNMSGLLLSNFLLNSISISLIILSTLNWKVSKVTHYLSVHNNS